MCLMFFGHANVLGVVGSWCNGIKARHALSCLALMCLALWLCTSRLFIAVWLRVVA